jgi:hypothetical protein
MPMTRRIAIASLLAAAALTAGPPARAARVRTGLRGFWTLTVQTPMGAIPVPVHFKASGEGSADLPSGEAGLVWRESGADVSLSFEAPGFAPDGADLTIVMRGTTDGTSLTATAVALTDAPDTASSTGFATLLFPVTGARN